MKMFFWAEEPFALKADGEFLGNFQGAAVIEDLTPAFIEALPHSDGEPIRFFADNRLISHKNAVFYDLPCGAAGAELKFGRRRYGGFRLLYQKRFENLLVTAYDDGDVKIAVENERNAQITEAPRGAENFCAELNGDLLAVTAGGENKFVAVFSASEEITLLFRNTVDEVEFNPVFRTKTTLFNVERTAAVCEWKRAENGFSPTLVSAESQNPWNNGKSEKFTERAFFERILYRLDTAALLAENVKKNAEKIPSYLGDFDGILPDFCAEKGVCLSYKGKDKRRVKNFCVDTENGFISNIREI